MYSLRMSADYKFPPGIERLIADCGARVRVGYPWWLRPWLMRGVIAITLGRTIFLRGGKINDRLLRHELVHVRQVNRLGLFVFLWRYVTEFFGHWRREGTMQHAYRCISFEVEACAEEESADV
jgi:hypothetical protein